VTSPIDRGTGQSTIVLIGAGHAHLHVLKNAELFHRLGIRLVLIAPACFDYSGLATGVLSGALPPGENTLDIAQLAAAHRVAHHVTEARDIDFKENFVRLADGAPVPFDLLSLNVGSVVADPSDLAALPGVVTVKPLSQLADLRRQIETAASAGDACPAIVVAGSGPSAFEIAAGIAGLSERRGIAPLITVVGPVTDADWAPRGALDAVTRRLARRGVRFFEGRVTGRTAVSCQLATGEQLPCDILVLATGLRGGSLAAACGLPVDGHGRLRVTNHLCSVAAENVFASGDCSVIVGDERPALGVFGVRAGPVLVHNLCAAAQGNMLSPYRPQSRWLSVLDLGDRTGLALYGDVWWLGRPQLWLKRWLDRRFLERHRVT